MDLQDPRIQKLLLASLAGVVVLYVFFGTKVVGFTYPAQKAHIEELSVEYEQLSRELERARLIVANMPKLEREFEYLHRQWQVAQTLLPEKNEISPLLRRVTAAGTQAGLAFVRFEPQATIGHGFYSENPIDVELEGGYHQVGSFISQLANMNRIINVRNIELEGVRPQEQADEDIHHTVTAKMEVVAYSIDQSAIVPAPGSDGAGATMDISAHNATASANKKQAATAAAGGGAR